MTNLEKYKIVLKLIQREIMNATENLIREEINYQTCKIRKEWKDKENDEGFLGINQYDEQLKRYLVCLEDARKDREMWQDIYNFTLNQIFDKYEKSS